MNKMIIFYHHKHPQFSNQEAERLISYIDDRLDCCPFASRKGACNSCKLHCYKGDEKALIKKIVNYAKYRMILRDPILMLKYYCFISKKK